MECPNCSLSYTNDAHCPRLLTACGHSICQDCLKKKYFEGAIICPECKKLNRSSNINMFPKNLALLHVAKANNNEKENKQIGDQISDKRKEVNSNCEKHGKKIEAFCENDRQLLCISCILEDGYKNHEITSIQNAAIQERKLMQKAHELTQIIEEKLKCNLDLIYESFNILTESAEKNLIQVQSLFNEIRRVMQERETEIKSAINDTLKKNEEILNGKDKLVNQHLDSVKRFYSEYLKSTQESDMALLRSSYSRMEMIKSATAITENFEFVNPFKELSRENEINQLWKHLCVLRSKENMVSLSVSKLAKSNSHAQIHFTPNGKKQTKDISARLFNKSPNNQQSLKKDSSLSSPGFVTANTGSSEKLKINNPPVFHYQIDDRNFKEENNVRKPSPHRTLTQEKKPSPLRPSNQNKSFQNNVNNINSHNENKLALEYQSEKPRSVSRNAFATRDENFSSNHVLSMQKSEGKSHRNITPQKVIDLSYEMDLGRSTTPNVRTLPAIPQESKEKKKNSQGPNIISPFYNKMMEFNTNKTLTTEAAPIQETLTTENYQSNTVEKSERLTTRERENQYNSAPRERVSTKPSESLKKDSISKMLTFETRQGITDREETAKNLDYSQLCQQISSYIYTFGGFVENSGIMIERYDLQKGKWDITGSISTNRTKFSSVLLPSNNIVILGGKINGSRTAHCEEYCIKETSVNKSEIVLTSAKSGFGCISYGDDIFVCGGNDGNAILRNFEKYNVKGKQWIGLAPMKIKRDELALTLGPDNRIYAIGGFGGQNNACLGSVERYDLQTGQWETVAPLNIPRRALSAVSLPDGLYAIGGFDGENYLSTVEKYDEVNNEWILVSSMNYPRCTLSAVVSSDCQNIYALGGYDNGPLKIVEKYSVIDDVWEIITPMPSKRFMHNSIMVSQ